MTAVDEGRAPEDDRGSSGVAGEGVPVTAHRSAPGRTVFVEEGNSDAWIASDLTVECGR
jgi:hypothetical protein